MLHARTDYNERIQDTAGIIPDDEPVFMLRGHDPNAPVLLELYVILEGRRQGADETLLRSVRRHASRMRKWQEEHGQKNPDMPADAILSEDN